MNPLNHPVGLAFPPINPVAFSIGPVEIHWYGIGYVVGILFAWWYACLLLSKPYLWRAGHPPMKAEKIGDFLIWAAIGIVVGGRLGQVLLWDPAFFAAHPLEIFKIWHGGMAFHGGFIGVIIASILFCLKNNIALLSMFDIMAAGAPFGLGIVRICNFINSELWGRVSDVAWAVRFPNGGVDSYGNLLARHPSQLYEAAMEGAILFLIISLLIFKKHILKTPGLAAGIFCIGYAMARTISEFYRVPAEDPLWFQAIFGAHFFTYGMLLSLPMVVAGLLLIYLSRPNK